MRSSLSPSFTGACLVNDTWGGTTSSIRPANAHYRLCVELTSTYNAPWSVWMMQPNSTPTCLASSKLCSIVTDADDLPPTCCTGSSSTVTGSTLSLSRRSGSGVRDTPPPITPACAPTSNVDSCTWLRPNPAIPSGAKLVSGSTTVPKTVIYAHTNTFNEYPRASQDLVVVFTVYASISFGECGAGGETCPSLSTLTVKIPSTGPVTSSVLNASDTGPHALPSCTAINTANPTYCTLGDFQCQLPLVCSEPSKTYVSKSACVAPTCSSDADCNGHGTCDPVAHMCTCTSGYGRLDCSFKFPTSTSNPPSTSFFHSRLFIILIVIVSAVLLVGVSVGIAKAVHKKHRLQ